MKKFIFAVLVAVAATFGLNTDASAFGMDSLAGVYVAPKVGVGYVQNDDIHANGSSVMKHSHDTAVTTGLSVGYNFAEKFELPVRAEVEYLYRGKDVIDAPTTTIKSEAHSVMANVAYDFKEVPFVTPYLTAGAGAAWLNDGGTNFAYNFGGGVLIPLTEKVGFDVAVRYVDYGRMNKWGYNVKEKGCNATVAVRYTF